MNLKHVFSKLLLLLQILGKADLYFSLCVSSQFICLISLLAMKSQSFTTDMPV